MTPLHIELLPARPVPKALAYLALVSFLLAIIALAGAGALRWQLTKALGNERELLAWVEQRQYTQPTPFMASVSVAPYDTDARVAWNEAIASTFSALTALETVAVIGVTPTAVELQAQHNLVRVEVEYSTYGTLIDYLDMLNEGEPLRRWKLQRANPPAVAGQTMGAALLDSSW